MAGHGSAEEALGWLGETADRAGNDSQAIHAASGTSSMATFADGTMTDFAAAVPLILTGRGGKRREARQASAGRVLLDTVTGPKVFENEEQARQYIG